METKKCTGKCGQIKSITEFSTRSDNGKAYNKCRQCVKEYYENYRKEKADKIKQQKLNHYLNNKNSILEEKKQYYKKNKERILHNSQKYYEDNKEELKIQHRAYYLKNRNKILRDKKLYSKRNQKKISRYTVQYFKLRRSKDPSFALRCDLSTTIGRALRLDISSKNGKSITEYLPYTIDELKVHLEAQFEPWMNWDNRGKYNEMSWNDNDPTTWTWQIDHIIPHSKFHYTSMTDQAFQDCWALSNLRPLSAKQNQADGASKTRHK
jgi:hypothetical protein